MATIGDIQRRIRARERRIGVFVAEGERPFFAPHGRNPHVEVAVTRELRRPGTWRVTWFDRGEPGGHVEAASFAEAVKLAVTEFAVDLGQASSLLTTGRDARQSTARDAPAYSTRDVKVALEKIRRRRR